MAINEKLQYLNETKSAIKSAILGRGVSVSDSDTFRSYADKIGQIESGGGSASATMYGVSIDNLLGNIVDGSYLLGAELFTFDASTFKTIGNVTTVEYPDGTFLSISSSLRYKFYQNLALVGTIDLSNLYDSSATSGLDSTFGNTGIEIVYMPKQLKSGTIYMNSTFVNCGRLHTVYIQSENFGGPGGIVMSYTFSNCPNLKNVYGLENITKAQIASAFAKTGLEGELRLTSLAEITGSCQRAFEETKITAVYFPALTVVSGTQMGSSSSNGMFAKCNQLTEIHFRADMQATIEALSGYASKFGATDATIYFDL